MICTSSHGEKPIYEDFAVEGSSSSSSEFSNLKSAHKKSSKHANKHNTPIIKTNWKCSKDNSYKHANKHNKSIIRTNWKSLKGNSSYVFASETLDNTSREMQEFCDLYKRTLSLKIEQNIDNGTSDINPLSSEKLCHYIIPTCIGKQHLFCYPRKYEQSRRKIIGRSNREAADLRPIYGEPEIIHKGSKLSPLCKKLFVKNMKKQAKALYDASIFGPGLM